MPRKLSRNDPCPCGSGKKYKQCCVNKDFDWVEMDDGRIGRSVPISDELRDVLKQQAEYQLARYGELQDRVFADAPPLELVEHLTVEAMKKGGVEPALIYAFEKTNGLLLNADNERRVPDSDIAQWDTAIDEYETKTGLKATRRRLNDDDFDAIMKNGPKERPSGAMVTRLAYRPPFEKEDWQKWGISSLLDEPECADYFDQCVRAVIQSGRSEMYLNVFLLMITVPEDERRQSNTGYGRALAAANERTLSAEEWIDGLDLVAQSCGPGCAIPNSAAAFEFLSFVADFVDAFAEHEGMAEDLAPSLEDIRGLAILAFVGAVNAEFGIQQDIWRGDGRDGPVSD